MLESEAHKLDDDEFEVIHMDECEGSKENSEEGNADVCMIEAFLNGNKSNDVSKNSYPYLTSALRPVAVCHNYYCTDSLNNLHLNYSD